MCALLSHSGLHKHYLKVINAACYRSGPVNGNDQSALKQRGLFVGVEDPHKHCHMLAVGNPSV